MDVQKKKAGAFISHLVWEWLYSEVSACKTRAELVKKSTADWSGWMWKLNYYFCNHSFQNFVILFQKILIALLLNITCGRGFLLKWAEKILKVTWAKRSAFPKLNRLWSPQGWKRFKPWSLSTYTAWKYGQDISSGSNSSMVPLIPGSKMLSLSSHPAMSFKERADIWGKLISADSISSASLILILLSKSRF